jgi:predicted Zn-dependent protease
VAELNAWIRKGGLRRSPPRDPSRWIWLGAMDRMYLFLGRYDDAIRMLQLSAEANPNDNLAYAGLAAAYALSG